MEETFIAYLNQPPYLLKVVTNSEEVLEVTFVEKEEKWTNNPPEILLQTLQQLQEYFLGNRKIFDLKLNPKGTDFQKKVWKNLEEIPFGKTKTYAQMAQNLGDPKVIRAAASANGKNPIAIIIPCHRVIGTNGSLTGYAGGLENKKRLLDFESGTWSLFSE